MVTRTKVLLVEDSASIQSIYKNMMTFEQFQVAVANNGMEAIKALSQDIPDIVLLDLMMPVMDGYKVLQVIKTDPKLAAIPVLVFSAKGQPEEVEKALSLGAAGYVVKATTKPKDVIEKMKAILSERQAAKVVSHYSVQITEGLLDAQRLSDDFNLNGFNCKVCGTKMLLDLIPDFSEKTPWFTCRIVCPKCHK